MDILLIRVEEKLTWADIADYADCLSRSRKAAIERKKQEGDRINALLSRLLLMSELTARTGIPERKIKFTYGTNGKPYLKGKELEFSLSHTDGAICAAFSETGEIGIDVERRDRRVSDTLYKRVLSEEEQFHLTSSADFMRFWVQKEAFLKRLGIGITRDLRGVNSLELPDTAAIDCGELFVGASGKGALDAVVREISVEEVLSRFGACNFQ
ncbi:MAG: 4'-phosphopantetheinyl transferase superfamily protein [Ruminococcaceae bacterium]|nr:4'-phosphopantetheinyl transferase superfamily protein [Oscillospiraceae bacterium]